MYKPEFAKKIYHALRFKAFQMFPEEVLKLQFKRRVGYDLNLENPRTFNEKLQWLKLYWRDDRATICADKFAVREYVKDKGLGHLLNEVYGVYDSPDDIDFSSLPSEFVMKPTHGSGKVVFCKDKKKLNWTKVKKDLFKWLSENYYDTSFEWIYKSIKPRIIVEKMIHTPDGKPPLDYKFFCFSGEPKCMFVASDRGQGTTKFDFFDLEWNHWSMINHYPNAVRELQKPVTLDKMIEYSKILASDFPHSRIDFYSENDEVLFGEVTFFHFAGLEPFEPVEYDHKLGSYLTLPPKHSKRKG